ncbi:ATP-binding protein [Streptacidiphilus sp. PB12-B1b]|uniref:ATP-binding protein n=1 Tax=Streptacidiphilus sp. PB12-B1b TaxID=2705012 RepID=UPI0015FB7F34|nr:ATP-binding protein [Streptacidiphilus sp. PB12-B1b]QMU76792.1 ATP-binding protein [Streptacidiphilus sp. PB12-B1b]
MDQQDHRQDHCESTYDLDGKPGSVGVALSHTRSFLSGCIPSLDPQTAQDLELLVSELVTNAVRHAPGPLTLTLCCDQYVEVAVTDTSVTAPTAREPDLAGGGGFGWHLVTALADQVRVNLAPPHGKTVSAAVTLH